MAPLSTWLQINRALLARMALGAVVVLALAALTALLLREPVTALGGWFVRELGYVGLALAVVFTDSFPFPLTHEPILLLAVTGGLPAWDVFWVGALASTGAGLVGYTGGAMLQRSTGLARRLRGRYPGVAALMGRYGALGVAVAALTPLPFSASTWLAGLMGVPVWKVAVASTLRIPKTGFYLWLLLQGWSLGA